MDSQGLCLLVLPFPPALTFSRLSSAWVPALPPCLPPAGFFRGPLPSQDPLCLLMSATSHQTCFLGIWVPDSYVCTHVPPHLPRGQGLSSVAPWPSGVPCMGIFVESHEGGEERESRILGCGLGSDCLTLTT